MHKLYLYIASVFLVLLLLWHMSNNSNREYLKSEKQIIKDLKSLVTYNDKIQQNMFKDFKKNITPKKWNVYTNQLNKKYNKIQKDIDAYTLKYGKDSKGAREIRKKINQITAREKAKVVNKMKNLGGKF